MLSYYHSDYIACSGYFRLSMHTWGILLAYIRRRLSSRLRFHVFWEAGRDISCLTCPISFQARRGRGRGVPWTKLRGGMHPIVTREAHMTRGTTTTQTTCDWWRHESVTFDSQPAGLATSGCFFSSGGSVPILLLSFFSIWLCTCALLVCIFVHLFLLHLRVR